MNQYSSDTVALLVEKLFVLRNATFQHHAEEAVETLLDVVDQHASDGAFMELVMSLKTMETLVRATKRPSVNSHFLHVAGGILFALVRESEDRSTHFVNSGALERILEIMQAHESDGFLMKAYLALVAVALDSMEAERCLSVGEHILETIVTVMEAHEFDAEVYHFGCLALRNCIVPGASLDAEYYHRAIQCIYQGVIRHEHLDEARNLGRRLLVAAVGPQYATEMEGVLEASQIRSDRK